MQWLRKYRKQLLLAGGYAVTAILLDLSSGAFVLQTGLAICYPPAGLYLAAILLLGWWALPLAFLNPVFSVLVTLQSPDIHPIAVIGIGVASMVSPAIALAALRKISPSGIRLNTIRDVVSFCTVILLATTVESLVAASVYIMAGLSTPDTFGTIATDWWISNIIPFLTLTPIILLWHHGWPDHDTKSHKIVLQAVLIVVVTPFVVLIALFTNGGTSVSRLYMAFLPILWAALVGGITGAAWESLVLTTTVLVLSPALLFAPGMVVEAQFFLLVAALTGLITGAIVTERRQAENSLIQFRKLMDETDDAFYLIDPQTSRYIDFNRSAHEKLGYSRGELGRLGVIDIAEHVTSLDVWKERVALVREKGGLIFESNYRRKDGIKFPTEVSARMLDYGGETIMVANVRDITRRKQAEFEREQLIRELAAKNAELTQFTYTVSHDLKSPLVTINGYLGYIEHDAASGNMERLKKDTQRIQDATNKMYALLTELLELSRIGRMMNAPEKVRFEDLVQDAMEAVHGQLSAHHVTVHSQPNLPAVHGDRQRLTEALQNLLENAVKYMGAQPDPHIEIGHRDEEDGRPIFFVKDNGIGIAPEFHERIFGLFNKLDAKSEGTGIGLTLVKRIIEVHGGRIWIQSEIGMGTTFYFSLPTI